MPAQNPAEPQPQAPSPTPLRRRTFGSRLVSAIKWAMLLFAIGLVVTVATGFYLLRKPPAYWQVVDASDPQVQQRADAMFNRVMSQATEVRQPDEQWELELTEEDVNAWLATRLAKWMANQDVTPKLAENLEKAGLPGELATNFKNPMVHFEGNRIHVAAEVAYEGYNQIVSMELERIESPDGSLQLKVGEFKGGSLPMPIDKLRNAARREFGSEEAAKAEAARRAAGKIRQSNIILPIDEHRQVKVNDLKLDGSTAVLVCETITTGR